MRQTERRKRKRKNNNKVKKDEFPHDHQLQITYKAILLVLAIHFLLQIKATNRRH
jgi:hypothetical protein